jgi:hypothetical protein
MNFQKERKTALLELLNNIEPQLEMLAGSKVWEASWAAIHGVNTSRLQGSKLGSMKGADKCYRIGIFKSAGRRLIKDNESPWVVASWDHDPSPADIIAGLREAS